jgi:hypothetical protein
VHQVNYLQELYRDARSTKYKILLYTFFFFQKTCYRLFTWVTLNPCHISTPYSSGLTPVLFSHLHLNFQTGLFISDFLFKLCRCISCYSVRAVCSTNPRFLDITLIAKSNRPKMKVSTFRSLTLHMQLYQIQGTAHGGYFARDKGELLYKPEMLLCWTAVGSCEVLWKGE